VGVLVGFPEPSNPTEPKANDLYPEAIAPDPNAYESSPVAFDALPRANAFEAVLMPATRTPAIEFFPIDVE
jgi:hypothetical protein